MYHSRFGARAPEASDCGMMFITARRAGKVRSRAAALGRAAGWAPWEFKFHFRSMPLEAPPQHPRTKCALDVRRAHHNSRMVSFYMRDRQQDLDSHRPALLTACRSDATGPSSSEPRSVCLQVGALDRLAAAYQRVCPVGRGPDHQAKSGFGGRPPGQGSDLVGCARAWMCVCVCLSHCCEFYFRAGVVNSATATRTTRCACPPPPGWVARAAIGATEAREAVAWLRLAVITAWLVVRETGRRAEAKRRRGQSPRRSQPHSGQRDPPPPETPAPQQTRGADGGAGGAQAPTGESGAQLPPAEQEAQPMHEDASKPAASPPPAAMEAQVGGPGAPPRLVRGLDDVLGAAGTSERHRLGPDFDAAKRPAQPAAKATPLMYQAAEPVQSPGPH